jgi:DNA topoisomerase III
VLEILQSFNPNLEVLRARFSAVTPNDIHNAMSNLIKPDKYLADSVDMRQEIDLKIGASFTRFQTLNFSQLTGDSNQVLSYGPCQFPTLGFIVERWKEINSFNAEAYWVFSFYLILI